MLILHPMVCPAISCKPLFSLTLNRKRRHFASSFPIISVHFQARLAFEASFYRKPAIEFISNDIKHEHHFACRLDEIVESGVSKHPQLFMVNLLASAFCLQPGEIIYFLTLSYKSWSYYSVCYYLNCCLFHFKFEMFFLLEHVGYVVDVIYMHVYIPITMYFYFRILQTAQCLHVDTQYNSVVGQAYSSLGTTDEV